MIVSALDSPPADIVAFRTGQTRWDAAPADVPRLFDAEGDFIAAVRNVVGPDIPIAASYDLHGNISQRIVDNLDIFSTYRTAPHIDVPDTMTESPSTTPSRISESPAMSLPIRTARR